MSTLTAAPGDPVPSSDLHRHRAHTWGTYICMYIHIYIHTGKILIHIKIDKRLKRDLRAVSEELLIFKE